jgi:hypothetical protein
MRCHTTHTHKHNICAYKFTYIYIYIGRQLANHVVPDLFYRCRYFNGQYVFVLSHDLVEDHLNKVTKKGPQVCPEHLHWAPLQFDNIKRDKWSFKAKSMENEE